MLRKKLVLLLIIFSVFILSCERRKINTSSKLPVDNPSYVIKDRLVVGLDDYFPPLGFRGNDNEIRGFEIDIVKEIAKRLNVDLILQPIHWDLKEYELNKGNIDIVWSGLSMDSERGRNMLLSEPYMSSKMVIVVRVDSVIKYKAGLKGKVIGVQTASSALKAIQSDRLSKETSQIVEYPNNIMAFGDLKDKIVDAVVVDEVFATYVIHKMDNDDFMILRESIGNNIYAVGFRKNDYKLRNKIMTTFNNMLKDGTAKKISDKWFGKDVFIKR